MFKSMKKLSALIVSILMLFSIIGIPAKAEGDANQYKEIQILSINDFHGSLKESGKNIGIAKLVGEVKNLKTQNPNTIFVSGGDLFQGSAESNLLYGKPVVDTLKEAGLFASAIGNHEYDWGANRIQEWAKEGGFEFLAANIYDKASNAPVKYAKPYIIKEVDGVKVAFIGLSTPETSYKTKPENVSDVEFKNPKGILPKYIKEVRDNGANIVIALTHLGVFNTDGKIVGEAADIASVEGLDGIIAAHSHQAIEGKVNNVPIVSAYYNGRSIGKLTFKIDKNTNKIAESDSKCDPLYKRVSELKEDENTKAIFDKYYKEVEPILSEKVGEAKVDIEHDRSKNDSASLMGEWVCEIMKESTKADIAIQNGGGLRISIPKGDITVGTMYELLPFDNTLFTMKLTGEQVIEAIENGIGNENIGFGQVAGVYVKYDITMPFGKRVIAVSLENGEALDLNKYYTVVVNDFMADGGDGYTVLKKGKELVDTGVPIRDAVIEYVRKEKVVAPKYKGYQSSVVQETVDAPEKIIYIVKKGDCLWRIGRKFGVSYKEIGKYNNIKNLNLIFPGQELLIPAN